MAVSAMMIIGVLASPAVFTGEPVAGLKRIGILYEDPQFVSSGEQTFRKTMRDLGYVEGRTIVYQTRQVAVHDLERAAQELVRSGVDLLITGGTPSTRAAKQAS